MRFKPRTFDFRLPLESIEEKRIRASKRIYIYVYRSVYARENVLTLAPIWLPHCPAWICTISRIFVSANGRKKRHENFNYGQTKTEISIEHPHRWSVGHPRTRYKSVDPRLDGICLPKAFRANRNRRTSVSPWRREGSRLAMIPFLLPSFLLSLSLSRALTSSLSLTRGRGYRSKFREIANERKRRNGNGNTVFRIRC